MSTEKKVEKKGIDNKKEEVKRRGYQKNRGGQGGEEETGTSKDI